MSEKDMDLNVLFETGPSKSNATPSETSQATAPSEKAQSTPANEELQTGILDEKPQKGQILSINEITYSPSRTNNYKTIRGISTVFKGLAWLSVGVAVLSVFGAIDALSNMRNGPGADFYVSLMFIFYTLSMAVFFAFLSEGINVILDMEANTRQTTKVLERLLRTQG